MLLLVLAAVAFCLMTIITESVFKAPSQRVAVRQSHRHPRGHVM